MVVKFFLYTLFGVFIIVGMIAEFVMWEFLSTGQWKTVRRRSTLPAYVYQDQIAFLTSQVEDERRVHQSEMYDLQRKHERELQTVRRLHVKI